MLTRSGVEERIKHGCLNKAGVIPVLGNTHMYAEFILEKHKSLSDNNGINVRHFKFMVGNRVFADFERNDASKNKVNQKSVVCIANHINHFLSYLQINDMNDDMLHFLSIMRDVDIKLSKDNIIANCVIGLDTVTIGEKRTYADNEKAYFLKVITDTVINDDRLLEAVSKYTYETTLYTSEVNIQQSDDDEEDDNKKLEKLDIHVLHVIAFYTKLLFILYYRIGGSGSWISIVKNELIHIANKANDYAIDRWFLEDISYITNRSFMDRLHDFLSFSMRKPLFDNQRNIDKFKCVGIDSTRLLHSVIEDVLSLLYRLNIVEYLDQKKQEEKIHDSDIVLYYKYKDIQQFPLTGLVDANTASYIHAAKKGIVKNRVGNFDPDYIIKSFENMDDSEDSSEATKFEMHLEKNDKEMSYKYNDAARTSMVEISSQIMNLKLLDSMKINPIKKNLLNQFLVSTYLEQIYGCDFSSSLSMSDFITVVVRVHEVLMYPKLKQAILGTTQSRANVNFVSLDEISTVYKVANADKVIKILSEITKYVYIFRVIGDDGVITYSNGLDIKSELLDFINAGCNFTVRG